MKIVHELSQLDFGGAEKVVRNIIKHDKENEHTIVTYKDGPYREELEKAGAKIIVVENLDEDIEGEADVVHIHSGGDISPMASQLAGQFTIVETIHSPIRSPMRTDLITQRVGVSEAVTRMNSNCLTILNGIDIEDSEPEKTVEEVKKQLGIDPTLPVIGRLGRLGLDKGLEEWLLACYELQNQGLKFVPLIVGDEARNARGYRGKLKLIAESLPVKDIIWAGNRKDVPNIMQVIDVFLYPSPTEGFGLVFIEAMLQGSIVVTYDTPVTREVIGGHAIITDRNKGIKGLVEGVNKALNPVMRDTLQGIQTNFVLGRYDAERMSLEYQEIYERSYKSFIGSIKPEAEHSVPA